MYNMDDMGDIAYAKAKKNSEQIATLTNDVIALDGRVDTIITTPIDGEGSAQELVDARGGNPTLGDRLDDFDSHLADYATFKEEMTQPDYSPLLSNSSPIFSVGTGEENGDAVDMASSVINGQFSDVILKGNTIFQQADSGISFANWVLIGSGSTKGANGVHLVDDGTIDYARLPLSLKTSTVYTVFFNVTAYTANTLRFRGETGNMGANTVDVDVTVNRAGQYKFSMTTKADLTSNNQLSVSIVNSTTGQYVDFKDVMVIEGDWTTKEVNYMTYGTKSTNSVRLRSVNSDETKESIAYVNLPPGEVLRSLPNGVKDEVSVSEGKVTQNVQEYVLQASSFYSIIKSAEALDYVTIRKPNNSKSKGDVTNDGVWTEFAGNLHSPNSSIPYDDARRIGFLAPNHDPNLYYYGMPNGTYEDLDEVIADLAGTTLNYQLAEPVITKLAPQTLEVFENGTVYVEPCFANVMTYDSTKGGLVFDYAVKEIERIRKDGENIEFTATLADDGLSTTITELLDGDTVFVVAPYRPGESTNPETLHKVAINQGAVIANNNAGVSANTKAIQLINEDLAILIVLNS